MLTYPIHLEEDDRTVLVTCPDFPELTTFGDDRDEALLRAVDALEEAMAAGVHAGLDIPSPTKKLSQNYMRWQRIALRQAQGERVFL